MADPAQTPAAALARLSVQMRREGYRVASSLLVEASGRREVSAPASQEHRLRASLDGWVHPGYVERLFARKRRFEMVAAFARLGPVAFTETKEGPVPMAALRKPEQPVDGKFGRDDEAFARHQHHHEQLRVVFHDAVRAHLASCAEHAGDFARTIVQSTHRMHSVGTEDSAHERHLEEAARAAEEARPALATLVQALNARDLDSLTTWYGTRGHLGYAAEYFPRLLVRLSQPLSGPLRRILSAYPENLPTESRLAVFGWVSGPATVEREVVETRVLAPGISYEQVVKRQVDHPVLLAWHRACVAAEPLYGLSYGGPWRSMAA